MLPHHKRRVWTPSTMAPHLHQHYAPIDIDDASGQADVPAVPRRLPLHRQGRTTRCRRGLLYFNDFYDQVLQRTTTMPPRSLKQSKLHQPCKRDHDNTTRCSTPTRRTTQADMDDIPSMLYRLMDR
jgi:hypothetical protein